MLFRIIFFRFYPFADAAVFHIRNFKYDSFFEKHRNPETLNIFFSLESPMNENLNSPVPNNFFNLTMTFRQDSDIWVPYDKFEKIEGNETPDEIWTDEQIEERLKKKSKIALQFVSNCDTVSSREYFVKALTKHMNVTVLGKCSRYRCPNQTCDEKALGEGFI